MKITLIIVSYKSLNNLIKCINSIGQKRKIIIIENSNDHNLKKIIEKKFKNTYVYLNKKNLGWAKASNMGLKKVKTDFAYAINPDIKISEANLLKIEKKIISKKILFDLATPIYDDLIDFIKNNNFDNYFENKILKDNKIKEISHVDYIKGSSLIFNLKRLKKRKIFDENFFFFFEELDLCRRIKSKNGKIILLNKIKIDHVGASSSNLKRANYDNFRNWNFFWSRFYYFKKHYGLTHSLIKHSGKFFRFFLNTLIYYFFSEKKFLMNRYRFLGLYNSILNNSSRKSIKILKP